MRPILITNATQNESAGRNNTDASMIGITKYRSVLPAAAPSIFAANVATVMVATSNLDAVVVYPRLPKSQIAPNKNAVMMVVQNVGIMGVLPTLPLSMIPPEIKVPIITPVSTTIVMMLSNHAFLFSTGPP